MPKPNKHPAGDAGNDAARGRRLPASQRRAIMLAAAAVYFAKHGFAASTRDLAEALGVTQALIYKHFESKEDLIEKTLESALGQSDGGPGWVGSPETLQADLTAFYRRFVARSTETRMRLFMRAGLEGLSWPTKRGHALTQKVFLPVIVALRQAAGLPGFDASPAMRGERELVMALHAGMVFLGIRRHVYGMPMPENLDDVVDLNVRTFVAGAVPGIARLHAEGGDSLTAQLLVPAVETVPDVAIVPDR